MKGNILHCEYDKNTGITVMGKQNKYGTFYATSIPVEQDMDIANQWTGGRLAEYKCDLQALKVKARIARERAEGARIALNGLKDNKPAKENACYTAGWLECYDRLNKQVYVLERESKRLTKLYKEAEKYYAEYAENEIKQKREVRNKKSAD